MTNRQVGLFLLIALLALTGCGLPGGIASPGGTPDMVRVATAIPQATRVPAIEAGIEVEAADGLKLAGTFFAPAESPSRGLG